MIIGREEVLHAAALAEIAVDEAELEALVAQLQSIVTYVEQLDEMPWLTDELYAGGPESVALREDVVRPAPLAHPLERMAPEFARGLFLVPRRGTMEPEE